MERANEWQAMDPVPYDIDGALNLSGVLDVARQVKMRIKAFAYAYRVTGQTSWADRAWKELQVVGLGCAFASITDITLLERRRSGLPTVRKRHGSLEHPTLPRRCRVLRGVRYRVRLAVRRLDRHAKGHDPNLHPQLRDQLRSPIVHPSNRIRMVADRQRQLELRVQRRVDHGGLGHPRRRYLR